MSDNRKYYYLKLKENYFDDDSIVLLESMQDGVLYSNILLKLYLKSLKHGGRLQLDENIPYTAQMIATITRQQIGTVERALQIFLKLGLVEVLDSGTFYMSNIELLIGQSSTEAERKRAARLQNKALSAPRTNGGHLSDIRPPEIEIELEKEIEIKREIEKGHPARAYGRYQNVFLADEELADLQASFPTVWGQYIEKLSEYMASTGKRYQSHAATIRCWACEDVKKTVTHSCNRDDSVKEDETVRLRLPQKSGRSSSHYQGRFSLEVLNSCEITSEHVGKVWISSIASFQILLIVGRGIFDAVVIFPTDFMQRIDFAFVGSILRGKPDLVTAEYGIF